MTEEKKPSPMRQAPAAAGLLLRRASGGLSVAWKRRALERRRADSLRDLGRHALDVELGDAAIMALQVSAREAFAAAEKQKAALSAIEGAPMPDDPEARRREEEERSSKTAGLRAELPALAAESDRRLAELAQRVLSLETSDPRLLSPIERHRGIEAAIAALALEAGRLRGEWDALPAAARGGAFVLNGAAAALLVGLLILLLGGGGTKPPRPHPPALPVTEEHAPPVAPIAPPTDRGVTTTTSHDTTPPVEHPVASTEETVPPPDPPVTSTDYIRGTGQKTLHALTVPPEFAAMRLNDKAIHLGDGEEKKWDAPQPVGLQAQVPFRFDKAPRGVSWLVVEEFEVDDIAGDLIRVNGKHVLPLDTQRKEEFIEVRYRISPRWLVAGENEIVFESGKPGDNADDFQIRGVRLEGGPVLYGIDLSKVPGVDTRLAVYEAQGDKPGREVLRIDETVVGEETYPNLSMRPGDYLIETTGDGKNTEIPYVLETQRLRPLGGGDEEEPNDRVEEATPIRLDEAMEGFLAKAGRQDWYRLTLTEDGYVAVSLSAIAGVDCVVRVRDARGGGEVVDVQTGGPGEPDEAEQIKLSAGTWMFVVEAREGSPAKSNPHVAYRLLVRRATAQAGFEEEPNNTAYQAQAIPLGHSLRGRLDPAEDQDWYKVHVDAPSLLKITVSGLEGVSLAVSIQGVGGDPLPGRSGADAVVTNLPVDPGDHAFGIMGKAAKRADRKETYRVRVEALAEPDGGCSVRNGSFETATEVTSDDTLRSALYPWEDGDWYKLTIKADDLVYRFKPVQFSFARLGVQIFDEKRTLLKTVCGTPLENWAPRVGACWLRVYRTQGGNHTEEYALRVQDDHVYTPEEERELNDSLETATPLPAETLLSAQLSPMGVEDRLRDQDWYRLDVPAGTGKVYAVEVDHDLKSLDVAMQVFDAKGTVFVPTVNQEGPGKGERIENWAPPAGTYYLQVWSPADFTKNAPYTVRWRETGRLSADREFEPNNTVAAANELKLDLVVQGKLASQEDLDVFKVVSSKQEPQVMRLRITGTDNLCAAVVLDAEGKQLTPDAQVRGGSVEIPGFVLSPGDALYVEVKTRGTWRATEADYSIVATEVESWKGAREAEPNFDWSKATKLEPGGEIKGEIAPEGDEDFFVWSVPEREKGAHTFSFLAPEGITMHLAICRLEGKEWITIAELNNDGNQKTPTIVKNLVPRPGRYGFKVTGWGTSPSSYTIQLGRQAGAEEGHDLEFNAPQAYAVPLEPGKPVHGSTSFIDDWDDFKVAGKGKAYKLTLKPEGEGALEVYIYRKAEKDWVEEKRFNVNRGETAVIERWQPGGMEHVVAVHGIWTPAPTYVVQLDEDSGDEAADVELNDGMESAVPVQLGTAMKGRIGYPSDQDWYRLDVPADGTLYALTYTGLKEGVSQLFWGPLNEEKTGVRWLSPGGGGLQVPAGKSFVDEMLLAKGTWYFAVVDGGARGAYALQIAAKEGVEADRLYECGASGYLPPEHAIDRAISGRLMPWGNADWDGMRFTLPEASSLDVTIEPPKDADVSLALLDAKANQLRAEVGTRLYVPKLDPGEYLLDVRGTGREEVDYRVTLRSGPVGRYRAEPWAETKLNVAYAPLGGHIVSCTSQYNEGWAPTNLLDGGVQSNGWSASDGKLPQEIVIGFAGDRVARIDRVRINPKTNDAPSNWTKTAEVLVSKSGSGTDWESVGKLSLTQEDKYVDLDFEPREAKQVMIRVLEHHGGSYAQLGEVIVREAVPGAQSIVCADHAIPLGASGWTEGVNPFFAAIGGKVESSTSDYNGDWTAANLIDGSISSNGWLSVDNKGPFEIVLAAPAEVEVSRVILSPRFRENAQSAVREAELWVSTQGKDAGFQKVASFTIDAGEAWQTFAFPPVKARWVKLRAVSNHGGTYFGLGEMMVVGR